MRVIITGGTGLIGRSLAEHLTADGCAVVVLSRRPGSRTLPKGVREVHWDGRSASGWGHLAAGADAIVNLAGAPIASGRWTNARKRMILQSRVDAGSAVVAAVRAAVKKPLVVIQSSATGYYGPRDDTPVSERTSPGGDFLASVCTAWESSTDALETLGVRRAVIRIGVVLHANGGALPRMMLPFRFFLGGRLGGGEQGLSWVHIEDVVRAIRYLMDTSSAKGVFNLCAPGSVSNARFAGVLGTVMRRPSWLPVPSFALRFLFGEMSSVLLTGQFIIPERLLALGFSFQFPGIPEALKDMIQRSHAAD